MGNLRHAEEGSGVVYGFLSRVLHFAELFQTDRFAFCWDSFTSRRRLMFPGYKMKKTTLGNEERAQLAEDMQQFDALRDWAIPNIGWRNVFIQAGYEADDLIAQMVRQQAYKETRTVLVSADADLYQLLRPGVEMYNPCTRKLWSPMTLYSVYGISPSQWPALKALAGCSSDAIPPCTRGVGMKTALKLLRGELSTSAKIAQDINTMQARAAYLRNLTLVTLPYPGTLPLAWNEFPPALHHAGLCKVSERYGLSSFIDIGSEVSWRWNTLISGQPGPAQITRGKRPPRPHVVLKDPRRKTT